MFYVILSGGVNLLVPDAAGLVDRSSIRDTGLSLARAVRVATAAASREGHSVLDSLSAGDAFGEMALIGQGKRPYTAVATGFTELMGVSQEEYDRVIGITPTLHLRDKLAFVSSVSEFEPRARADGARPRAPMTPSALTSLCSILEELQLSRGCAVAHEGDE